MSDRDIFLGLHLTLDVKEKLRFEATRRKISMSKLASCIIEDWLITASQEQVEEVRSNKRTQIKEEDIPLPFKG